ncbi:MAG: hypothetical protein LUQ65_12805 [Candidatus Helarchaeota archaeon]|nr:hypothetical protein [Candidatus Helarchaeota archaeon]
MSEMDMNKRIVRDMLRYSPCPQMGHIVKADNLDSWGLSREVGTFLLQNPNALLFGALFDYLWDYRKAWQSPFELHKRLGHLGPFRLARMSERQLLPYLQRGKYGQALHRFPPTLTRRIILASKKLINEYEGNASNIWPNGTPANIVLERLEEFEGISQKISHMMGRLLGTYFGVSLTHWNRIDVAVDRHVARVFLRTGLVNRRRDVYSVAEVKDEVIQCARVLKPSFPGCLDEPAFDIGINWCTAEKAYCDWYEEPCPLHNTCRRKIYMNTK